jgi:ketosteroid isomerase-like protein
MIAGPRRSGLIAGALGMLAARALLLRLILLKFNRDVERLNAGDYRPLLAGYAENAVLRFNDGPHRWTGEYRGKEEIGRFLSEFVRAGIQGEICKLWIAGPPWALTLLARFDDRASGPDGEQIYANRTVLLVRTRWGKIVEHEDFYEDTERIREFDAKLTELGIEPI